MTSSIQVALLLFVIVVAVAVVVLPIVRPPANAEEHPALAAREEGRARLFAALEELGRDLRAGMISQSDHGAAVREIRRRLSRL